MIHIISLEAPAPIDVVDGDIVRVDFTFSYKGPPQSIIVCADIGQTGLFGWSRAGSNSGTVGVAVDSIADFSNYSGSVFILVSSLSAGQYDVAVYVPGREDDTFAVVEDIVNVAGAAGILDSLSMMVGVMMMAMVIPMVMPMFAGEEGEVSGGL